jgi:hypothetical protein
LRNLQNLGTVLLGLAAACTSCGDAELMMMVNLAVMAMARRISRGL